jgi:deazaflavin-dependent oxidoreductase (nitroreductase family)
VARETTLLSYLADGDRYIVAAVAGGAPASPDWHHNLIAHPGVTVEAGTEVFGATAVITTGEEREALFERFAAVQLSWPSTRTEPPARSLWSPSAGERTEPRCPRAAAGLGPAIITASKWWPGMYVGRQRRWGRRAP